MEILSSIQIFGLAFFLLGFPVVIIAVILKDIHAWIRKLKLKEKGKL